MTNHEIIMLLDFYGNMLTEKQYECMNLYFNEDLTLTEIAEHLEITRQAVHDMIRRCQSTLTDIEDKLGFLQRYTSQVHTLRTILKEIKEIKPSGNGLYCISKLKMHKIIDNIKSIIND